MGDGLKLSKDKRHRSSSSLAGLLDGTRSERKLTIKASIPELEDHFALAEARCDDLQEKIDLVKGLKKKKRLKKRSMTRVTDQPPVENVPFISVRTQPKKKASLQAARLRRLEAPTNPTRSYLDPATVEQHRMIRGYNQIHKQTTEDKNKSKHSVVDRTLYPRLLNPKERQALAEGGDSMIETNSEMASNCEVACGQDDAVFNDSDNDIYNEGLDNFSIIVNKKLPAVKRLQQKSLSVSRGRPTPTENITKEGQAATSRRPDDTARKTLRELRTPVANRRYQASTTQQQIIAATTTRHDERQVVELFSNNRPAPSQSSKTRSRNVPQPSTSSEKPFDVSEHNGPRSSIEEQMTGPLGSEAHEEIRDDKDLCQGSRRVRFRSRRYELPTVASQMKQAGVRYYYGTVNNTNIPFIVSKSTAPSHNIGVNIQQVLNGIKIQQPLSGIPFTIAHHMGLGYIPNYGVKTPGVPCRQQPSLDAREMNAIKLGRRLLRLPSYKYVSYNRLLSLYREGDGIVSRFLRAISRPHYFYTSMYDLSTREDFDGATSKARAGVNQDAKQSLADYANLYREYEQVERTLKEDYDAELEHHKEDLARQLASRENYIRKVMQEYKAGGEVDQPTPCRASASTAEESFRQSALKLNIEDAHE